MKRALREHLKEVIAILGLVVAAVLVTGVILSNQSSSLPSWVPVLGKDRFELKAEFSSAQAVTPGQGQSVDIAGVDVGDVSGVTLENGHAVVTMQVDKKYVPLIHNDSTLLLRPKTGLNDMVLELDPGTAASGDVEEGDTIPLANTQPNVNPDEVLASLDADTRNFLNLLLANGAEGLGGKNAIVASNSLRRFEPLSRDLAKISGALSKRSDHIRHAIHNFRLVNEAIGDKDSQLASFVESSNGVLAAFARQEASIRATLRELPGALQATNTALSGTDQLSLQLGPAMRKLLPGARALKPSLKATQPFFRDTTGPIRDQIRPFTTQVATPVLHTRQLAQGLDKTVPATRKALGQLNPGLNALAYNPPGANEGFLFYLPWLNHNTNDIFLTQDAHGPLRRGIVMLSCSESRTAAGIAAARPFLQALLDLTNQPTPADIC